MKKLMIAALAGLMVSCGQNSAPMPEISETETAGIETLSTAADIISVSRQGNPDGRTVVLIPGLASSADVWTDTAAALAEYDIRLVQVAGFAGAKSQKVEGKYTDLIAAKLNAHLRETPGNSPVLIGHSMGGFVALKAALGDDSKIEELIIVDSLPFLAEMFMPGTTPEQAAQMAPMMALQMQNMPREAFDVQQAAGLPRMAKTRAYHATLRSWAKASDQTTVAAVMGEMLAADLRPSLSDISAEITVLAAHDKAMGLPVSQIENLYAAQYAGAPKHNIHVVEDSFHFIMVDQPTAFVDAVKEVLTD